jgi:hypothetical protein
MRPTGTLAIPCLFSLCALLVARDAWPRAMPAQAGLPENSFQGWSCWGTDGTGVGNICGSGTTDTEWWNMPLPVDAYATFNVREDVYGSYLQTGPWVSCIAEAESVESNNEWTFTTSSRATTSTTGVQWQTLNLGTVSVFGGASLLMYCQATYQGQMAQSNWW